MSNNMIFIFHSNEQGRPILKNLNFLARKKEGKKVAEAFGLECAQQTDLVLPGVYKNEFL